MRKRTAVLGVAAVLALAGMTWAGRTLWSPQGAVAQAPADSAARRGGQNAGVPVEVANAVRKEMPARLEALGTVSPMASVAIKTRVDSEIIGVHFSDGAVVKKGDLLFTLDSRSLEA